MRFLPFLICAVVTFALTWLLAMPLEFGGKPLPPIGAFFNPFSGFWQNAEPSDLSNLLGKQELKLPGLKGKVSVAYDDLLVPHIFAENLPDAFQVQGYITAQQRLWQMDMNARQTGGRLSEVLGERTFEVDREIRRRGLPKAAELDWEAWQQSEPTRTMFEAYAAGVNAWIDQLDPAEYPLEYKLLNFKPEHWTPLKTALIIESMIDALNNRDDDLEATNALALLGRDTFNYLFPEWFSKQKPVVPDTGQWKNLLPSTGNTTGFSDASVHPAEGICARKLPSDMLPMNGSNNWAVAGSRTKSGFPILCNDTHLPLRLPHVWFQVQIHTPEYNSYGIIVPGVPGIVIGFNENIAWGFTNVSQEVADWYKIHWTDATRSHYWLDGQQKAVETRIETIGIKGKPAFVDTVRYTVWGPVVYDFAPAAPLADYAYRYSTHDKPDKDDLTHFFAINQGKNYADYRNAIPGLECLSQNVVFASRSGDIAITVQGRFPIRPEGAGLFLQEGDQSAQAWKGYIPVKDLPAMKNPGRGFVFSANQHSTPPSYPYHYVGHFDASRARRIYDRLEHMQDITADSMKSIQLDNYSYVAGDALPVMLRLLDGVSLNEQETRYLEALKKWDCRYIRSSIAPSLFTMWFDSCYQKTWDELDVQREKGISIRYPNAWRFTEIMAGDASSVFFDHPGTTKKETAADIVLEGFRAMADKAAGMPNEELAWQRFKGFKLMHMARLDAFSRLDLVTDGTGTAPNAIKGNHGPSFRMIVELGPELHAQGVYPGGQSGNPGSAYYDSMLDEWAAGEYFNLLFLKNAQDDGAGRLKGTVSFAPK